MPAYQELRLGEGSGKPALLWEVLVYEDDGGSVHPGHSVLASRSGHFKRLFTSGQSFGDAPQARIPMRGRRHAVPREAVRAMCSGAAAPRVNDSNAAELLELADRLHVPALAAHAAGFLQQRLAPGNTLCTLWPASTAASSCRPPWPLLPRPTFRVRQLTPRSSCSSRRPAAVRDCGDERRRAGPGTAPVGRVDPGGSAGCGGRVGRLAGVRAARLLASIACSAEAPARGAAQAALHRAPFLGGWRDRSERRFQDVGQATCQARYKTSVHAAPGPMCTPWGQLRPAPPGAVHTPIKPWGGLSSLGKRATCLWCQDPRRRAAG